MQESDLVSKTDFLEDVRYWHLTDLSDEAEYVCFRMQSGRDQVAF